MTALPPGRPAVLVWGIRAALREYMARDPGFEVETTGTASFTFEDGVRMAGRSDASGLVRFDGTVVLRAHQGALTVPLVGVQVSATALTIEDPFAESDEAGESDGPARHTFVLLEQVDGPAPDTAEFTARLAADSDALFMYTYAPGTAFDPLRVTFSPV